MNYQVDLDIFQGPLDLLLYLIKKEEVDICDIPISRITEQYLEYIDLLQALNLNLAGDFLLMASTLMYIKSRMLLPVEETGEDGEEGLDPREELVQRLLEYRRFKDAAEELQQRDQLDRDFFIRPMMIPSNGEPPEDPALGEVSLIKLIEALRTVLKQFPEEAVHQVTLEHGTIKERIMEITEALDENNGSLEFHTLFAKCRSRIDAIFIFLALLEMVKIQMIKINQSTAFGPIHVVTAVHAAEINEEPSSDTLEDGPDEPSDVQGKGSSGSE